MDETLSELLRRCQTGDPAAIEALVRRFQPWATALASGLLDDPDLAEDAVQEAFLSALERLPSLREPEAFTGWFRRILRTQANRILRKRREVSLEEAGDIAAPEESAATRMERESLRRFVREALQTLPSPRRRAAELFYLEDKSCAEIADSLRVPLGTVKRRLHDARRELRELLLGTIEGAPSAPRPTPSRNDAPSSSPNPRKERLP